MASARLRQSLGVWRAAAALRDSKTVRKVALRLEQAESREETRESEASDGTAGVKLSLDLPLAPNA